MCYLARLSNPSGPADQRVHVVIVNERFLPRFGVDRMLLKIAETLRSEGHRVTLICARCDKAAAEAKSDKLVILEMPPLGLREIDEQMSATVDEQWCALFGNTRPTAFLIGGWPFFSLAKVCASRGVPTIFGDAGAVPHDGMDDNARAPQLELRRLRALTLQWFSAITPISEFIAKSQTLPDRGGSKGVTVIHLGADHLSAGALRAPVLDAVRVRKAAGHPCGFVMGRWEPDNYKNTGEVFEIARHVRRTHPNFFLAILASEEDIDVPRDLANAVVTVGHVDDAAMLDLMLLADVGLSPSLWEGFNLPLVEMQYLERPALALAVGAHPEVIVDPWFLCRDIEDMGFKAAMILDRQSPPAPPGAYEKFQAEFTWARTVDCYIREIEGLKRPKGGEGQSPRFVFDVTNSARDSANSGVVRVTRQLSAALQRAGELPILFVSWDHERKGYRLLWPEERPYLRSYGGPKESAGTLWADPAPPKMLAEVLRGGGGKLVVVFPEVVMDHSMQERVAWVRARGGKGAAILYDLIPLNYSQYTSQALTESFAPYINAMLDLDAVYGISQFCLGELVQYAADVNVDMPLGSHAVLLPGQFSNLDRRTPADKTRSDTVRILCVSTIEPRKNHVTLLAAYRALRKRRPDLPLRLDLVGNAYKGKDELIDLVQAACMDDPTITWHGAASDEVVIDLYAQAAFSVYSSIVEGFGLPVLESLWMSTPCICHKGGVMAELAADGGCMTVDMLDPEMLAQSMERLAEDEAMRDALSAAAALREIKTWDGYAAEISGHLLELAA
jgi:glycosyltransferase involved in cell wall biosynthesis